jgi:hypothetical protein
MDLKFKDLVARAMELPPEDRRRLAQLLVESAEANQVRDSGASYLNLQPKGSIGMALLTVVLPDELAKRAQAAGLLAEKRLEELIRHALKEQSANKPSNQDTTRQHRRLVRQNGHLVVEALPDEQLITDTEIRDLLNKMEW